MKARTDCKFYNEHYKRCVGLKDLYCKTGSCSFFKPKDQNEDDQEDPERDEQWQE